MIVYIVFESSIRDSAVLKVFAEEEDAQNWVIENILMLIDDRPVLEEKALEYIEGRVVTE